MAKLHENGLIVRVAVLGPLTIAEKGDIIRNMLNARSDVLVVNITDALDRPLPTPEGCRILRAEE